MRKVRSHHKNPIAKNYEEVLYGDGTHWGNSSEYIKVPGRSNFGILKIGDHRDPKNDIGILLTTYFGWIQVGACISTIECAI